MLNQTVIVGRIMEINTDTNEMLIKVPRSFKNDKGVYEEDIIPVMLSPNIMNNAKEYCKVDDLVGIKGRLESIDMRLTVIGEKMTFLSSSKEGGE